MSELLGYARVSTSEQSGAGQVDALRAAGVEHVWTDVGSGMRADRPQLTELLATVEKGDTVVVCRLDRLGRSLSNLLNLVEDLTARMWGCGRSQRHEPYGHRCERGLSALLARRVRSAF